MQENTKKVMLSCVLLLVGAIINVLPELISSVLSVIMMGYGLWLGYKYSFKKSIVITSIVFNVISFIVCLYCFAIMVIVGNDSLKIGFLPMDITCIISFILTVATFVMTIVLMKKKATK